MNKVLLVGRLTKDPELKSYDENSCGIFYIAVNGPYIKSTGEREVSYVRIIAWGRKGEAVCENLSKGSLISITGRIHTGSYADGEGNKKFFTEVIAEDIQFFSKKTSESESA